jgi:hypothetical protein
VQHASKCSPGGADIRVVIQLMMLGAGGVVLAVFTLIAAFVLVAR